jgi:predicted MFS family arabinose efflux permease
LISGLASTPAGVLLDRHGGRLVMGAGSLLAGAGMLLLGTTHDVAQYFLAWALLGVAMALTLYDAAFATINREFFHDARKGISVLTLFGGLASTVFWPLTLKLNTALGWRETFLVFGAIHLLLCLPLHVALPVRPRSAHPVHAHASEGRNYTLMEALRDATFWKLAFAFSANVFVFAVLSVHLIPLLQRFGHSADTAVLVAALIGPMQVAGRIGEMSFARHVSPQNVGKIVFGLLPLALAALAALGEYTPAIAGFCILYGVSNGVLTIVRGTIPQTLFGRANYGAISGAMSGPGLAAKAAGPLAGAALAGTGASPCLLLGVLFVVSLASLLCYLAAMRGNRFRHRAEEHCESRCAGEAGGEER